MMPRAANNYPHEKEVDDDLRSDPHRILSLVLVGAIVATRRGAQVNS